MKIFSASQIREWDSFTIEHEPIKSIDLMERASRAFAKAFMDEVAVDLPVTVFAGPGNNGGDGLAIARMLLENGYQSTVYVAAFTDNFSKDFQENLNRLSHLTTVVFIKTIDDIPTLDKKGVIIEALFGTGINRPVEGLPALIIEQINMSDNRTYAVDIPSGMSCDKSLKGGAIIEADKTFTFQVPKLTFFFPENDRHLGRWKVLDIGLSKSYLEETSTAHNYTQEDWINKFIVPRAKFSHKGTYGHALLVAGSFGKIGAAILSAKASLRAGTGLLTVHIPACGYQIMQQSIPEVMTIVDVQQDFVTSFPDVLKYEAVGIGPGLGTERNTFRALEQFLRRETLPHLVIDADGLNMLSMDKKLLDLLPSKTVLTPHPGEFKRFVGDWVNDRDRLERQIALAKEKDLVVVLKGAHSSVALPDGTVFFNSTGNPGMATAGSGDVLTGIILGLLSQGYTPEQAAVVGVFLHGYAGDEAAKQYSEASMIASDIIENIGKFFLAFT